MDHVKEQLQKQIDDGMPNAMSLVVKAPTCACAIS